MSAAAELQKAIFKALRQDARVSRLLGSGGRIFDHAPADIGFPYITFGRTGSYDWSTGTETGCEHLVTLHVWSKAKGKAESLELIEAASARLHDGALALNGYRLVNLRLEFSETRFDDDLSVYHGLMRFRAVTEAAG